MSHSVMINERNCWWRAANILGLFPVIIQESAGEYNKNSTHVGEASLWLTSLLTICMIKLVWKENRLLNVWFALIL